jgi:hypothetical protein
MWIWGSFTKDSLWLFLPGLLTVFVARLIPEDHDSVAFLAFAFITLGFLDSGHVYATLWRTYFHPREWRRSRVYWIVPAALFAIFFCWVFFQIRYLSAMIVYATLFHNIRQFYGISKWYQKLNGLMRVDSDRFLYFLSVMPMFMAHFRVDFPYEIPGVSMYPHAGLFASFTWLYGLVICGWILFETQAFRQSRDWNRTLSVAFPAALYGFTFLGAQTPAQILFPLVVSHGLAYIGLVSLSVERTRVVTASPVKIVFLVLVTAVFFGGAERVFEYVWLDLANPRKAVLAAIYLTPLFSHYVFDAFLWKRTHPESELIYRVT